MMEVENVRMDLQNNENCLIHRRFEAAVKVIKSLPPDGPFQPSNDMMLRFYSFYKQATLGPCDIPRPGFWDAVGKAKWDSWHSLGDMSKEEAMAAYVDEMKLILEGMPVTEEVEELLLVLGPFYEMVEEKKKKITQISDLSSGFGTTMDSMSVTKSIVRSMEMNGSLRTQPDRLRVKDVKETSEEEEEDEDEAEEGEVKEEEEDVELREDRKALQPKKRRHKVPLSNGKMTNGVNHLTNGGHSKVALNSDYSVEGLVGEHLLNGHHADLVGDVPGSNHVASDSDSEVYCDSVDQFGQDESPDLNRSLEDLDEEEPQGLQPPETAQRIQADVHGPLKMIKCGGEDGDSSGTAPQRQRLHGNVQNIRGGRGSRSQVPGPGALMPLHSGEDGDEGRGRGLVPPGGSLNEQIVVALARLQEDMQSVLERLHTLEALSASQARSLSLSPTYTPPMKKKSQKPSWWPFDISPASLAFAVMWPFVVQWLLRLFLHRRRRIN